MNTETLIALSIILWISAMVMTSLCCLLTVILLKKVRRRESLSDGEKETRYLDSIPGMTQSILDGARESFDDCIPEEKVERSTK